MVFPKYYVSKRALPDGDEQVASLSPTMSDVDEIIYISSDDDASVVEVDINVVPQNTVYPLPLVHFPTTESTSMVQSPYLWFGGYDDAIAEKQDIWNMRFDELCRYKKENGHCSVPAKHVDNPSLGNWTQAQRAEYRKWLDEKPSAMTKERIDQLNAINFPWIVNDNTAWKSNLLLLKEYEEKYGHFRINRSLGYDKLGKWVDCQRTEYRKWMNGKTSSMTQERIDQLNALGLPWEGIVSWESKMELLKAYKEKYGHCRVTRGHFELGQWVSRQRKEFQKFLQGKPSSMTKEHIKKLNALGFLWKADAWHPKLVILKAYKEEFGDCRVPRSHDELGEWVATQRSQYQNFLRGKPSPMTQERIDHLNALGFLWKANAWHQHLELLKAYKEKYGDCRVPRRKNKLGEWVAHQRWEYNKLCRCKPSSLTQERIGKLNAIGFSWTTARSWQPKLELLKDYKEKHGHCQVPRDHGKLGEWVTRQRSEFNKLRRGKPSSLTKERIVQLEKLGFRWRLITKATK